MSKILLKNVRLSFPSVFQKAVFDGKEGKYEATFLISKEDTKTKAVLDAAIADAIKAAGIKVSGDKLCLKDGDDSTYDGYENTWSLKAANGKRPTVIDRDKSPIIENDEKLYAGCYVNAVVEQVAKTDANNLDEFLAEPWELDTDKTVEQELSSQISIIGENMKIRRIDKIVTDNGFVESYVHSGGKIAVLVEMESDVVNDIAKEAAKNVAMQVAAIAPKYLNREEIPQEYIEKEKEILKVQAMNEDSNKPEHIIEKIIEGRLNKELQAVSLVDQEYVKDSSLTVQKYLDQISKEIGSELSIKKYVRYETGEGIEKREENFAEEVAQQLGR